MNKTVKKVLGIGIFFGIFVFSVPYSFAEDLLYKPNCSSVQGGGFGFIGLGKMTTCFSIGCSVMNEDADGNKFPEYEKEKYGPAVTWSCEEESGFDPAKVELHKCEEAQLEYENDDKFQNYTSVVSKLNTLCIGTAEQGSEDKCEEVLNPRADSNNDALTKSLYRKFKRACKADAKIALSAAENGVGLGLEEAGEYAPFGVYEGPAFGGPGLKAGSRIAKSKLDNTISKEESIKKLAIGWVNLALSLVAILAVIAVIYAGILYITSMGDDGNKDKAKNIIMYVALGILLIFGSYAIVKALLSVNTGNVSITYLIAEIFV